MLSKFRNTGRSVQVCYRQLPALALDDREPDVDDPRVDGPAVQTVQQEARRLAAEYRRGEEQLSQYADLPHPPAEWASALPDLIVEETRLQTELTGITQREQKVREELEGLVVENSLLEMADQLDQLSDAAARYATAQEDLPKRKQALSESNRKVDLILAAIGQTDVEDPKSLLIPAATIGTLRDLISAKSGVDVARQSAEKEHETARQAVEKEERDRQALDGQGAALDAGKVAQLQSVLRRLRDAIDESSALQMTYRKSDYEESTRTIRPVFVGDIEFKGNTFHGLRAHQRTASSLYLTEPGGDFNLPFGRWGDPPLPPIEVEDGTEPGTAHAFERDARHVFTAHAAPARRPAQAPSRVKSRGAPTPRQTLKYLSQ